SPLACPPRAQPSPTDLLSLRSPLPIVPRSRSLSPLVPLPCFFALARSEKKKSLRRRMTKTPPLGQPPIPSPLLPRPADDGTAGRAVPCLGALGSLFLLLGCSS